MNVEQALLISSETPYMAVDLNQTMNNIRKFQEIANKGHKTLRPHSKTHKIPYLAKLQLEEGASGVCVQKVAEAEVMFNGGISDILISNEVIDKRKCDRIARLSKNNCRISVAVDSLDGATNLSESAAYLNQVIPVLIDINIGMDRCGIDSEEVLKFHSELKKLPNIRVDGIMAYDGQVHSPKAAEREEMVNRERVIVQDIFQKLKKIDPNIKVLTVGGTPSSEIWSHFEEVSEIQPGTYIFYDMHCQEMGLCGMDEVSMGVVGQVMSMKHGKRIVLDAGYKSISLDQGVYPVAVNQKGIVGKVVSMSEEHTVIKPDQEDIELGSKVLLLPYHACTTTDFWDYAWIYDGKELPVMTKIMGRGKRE
ncbi:alanine racemase [Ferroplasma acidiphilum]|uniref:alanine racemase n=1 Tax=Ferroplasma acidiphilum TaxID=74969 RepID=UPI00281566DE|nr:alanine racemase [Ferroplasma acidiphilum]WMT52535.1 MAG: alanine racemase [Ferroplasma acidiphilum]